MREWVPLIFNTTVIVKCPEHWNPSLARQAQLNPPRTGCWLVSGQTHSVLFKEGRFLLPGTSGHWNPPGVWGCELTEGRGCVVPFPVVHGWFIADPQEMSVKEWSFIRPWSRHGCLPVPGCPLDGKLSSILDWCQGPGLGDALCGVVYWKSSFIQNTDILSRMQVCKASGNARQPEWISLLFQVDDGHTFVIPTLPAKCFLNKENGFLRGGERAELSLEALLGIVICIFSCNSYDPTP